MVKCGIKGHIKLCRPTHLRDAKPSTAAQRAENPSFPTAALARRHARMQHSELCNAARVGTLDPPAAAAPPRRSPAAAVSVAGRVSAEQHLTLRRSHTLQVGGRNDGNNSSAAPVKTCPSKNDLEQNRASAPGRLQRGRAASRQAERMSREQQYNRMWLTGRRGQGWSRAFKTGGFGGMAWSEAKQGQRVGAAARARPPHSSSVGTCSMQGCPSFTSSACGRGVGGGGRRQQFMPGRAGRHRRTALLPLPACPRSRATPLPACPALRAQALHPARRPAPCRTRVIVLMSAEGPLNWMGPGERHQSWMAQMARMEVYEVKAGPCRSTSALRITGLSLQGWGGG